MFEGNSGERAAGKKLLVRLNIAYPRGRIFVSSGAFIVWEGSRTTKYAMATAATARKAPSNLAVPGGIGNSLTDAFADGHQLLKIGQCQLNARENNSRHRRC